MNNFLEAIQSISAYFYIDISTQQKHSSHPTAQRKTPINQSDSINLNPITMHNRKIIALHGTLQDVAIRGSSKNIKPLLKQGAQINEKNNQSNTALHVSVQHKNHEALTELIKNNADIHIKNNNGDAPIHIACKNHDATSLTALLEAGADIYQENSLGNALVVSIKHQSMNCFMHLLNNHDYLLTDGKTILRLIEAIKNRRIGLYTSKEELIILLKKLNDINWKDASGKDAVMHILTFTTPRDRLSNFKPLVELLTNTKLVKDNNNNNLWHFAAKYSHRSIFPYLAEKSIDINEINNFGSTPFLSACKIVKNKKTLIDLIKHGANPEVYNTSGYNALHACVFNDNINEDTVKFLLKYISIDSKTIKYGNTLLHIAVTGGNKELVEILIKNGADINLQNLQEKTPLDQAKDNLDKCIIEIDKLQECKVMTKEQQEELADILDEKENYIDIVNMLTAVSHSLAKSPACNIL